MRALTSTRLILPPWDPRFQEDFCRLSADPRVTRYLGDGRPWDRGRAIARHRELLAHWREHGFGWRAILLRGTVDGPVIGAAALNRLPRPVPGVDEPVIEIGWWVDPRHWGQGIATEAATAIRDEAFTDHHAARLVAFYQPENHASGNIMRKIGMRHHADITGPYGEAVRVRVLERADWARLPVGAEALRSRLRHVYWIGGGSGAGKSTIARRLAARHGLRLYSADDVMSGHGHRITREEAPFLRAFAVMSMDERWVNRSPETMLGTFHWFRGEGFRLIIEDLLDLPAKPGVVAEGFRLLPHLVRPYLAVPCHAVWLLPAPAFRRAAFHSRGTLWQIPRKTSDPDRALHNLLERDRMFTDRLRAEAKSLDLHVIEVGTGTTEDELMDQVTRVFRL